ncbi:glycosyl transferase family protein [Aspergillus steynii IBT 23096]|uniref:Glycosyl transferase family protein n=1 Tax=Aspergillus steynii IBT 23096 TaxID=1392250 RepID=A0A2I2GFR7_9EURO|nr:glycosyl transferase family protein [Aspergillus steynii IBT 23096]PLB51701.1 glycosyl transferase family protein [Aspergillus steynii IBT 23096]
MAESTNPPKRIWASLITNLDYLPGLLTLFHSLRSTNTQYPFVAFYTSSFPAEGQAALHARGIRTQPVPNLQPGQSREYAHDPRFQETWTKLVVFSLVEYDRIVLLDGDMLGETEGEETGNRVFAASHACACNPLKKSHYPKTWIPSNCAFTTQHATPSAAQTSGAPSSTGVGMLNSGLLVVVPSQSTFSLIRDAMDTPSRTAGYDFPDQELLSDVFRGRWVALPYVYNALKTLRWEGVHDAIWQDEQVKNVHYIFAKKPWHEDPVAEEAEMDETNRWWWRANLERQRGEREGGITDGY